MLASALSVAKLPYDQAQDGISLTATVIPAGLGHTPVEQARNLVGLLDAYTLWQRLPPQRQRAQPGDPRGRHGAPGEVPAADDPGVRLRGQLRPADPRAAARRAVPHVPRQAGISTTAVTESEQATCHDRHPRHARPIGHRPSRTRIARCSAAGAAAPASVGQRAFLGAGDGGRRSRHPADDLPVRLRAALPVLPEPRHLADAGRHPDHHSARSPPDRPLRAGAQGGARRGDTDRRGTVAAGRPSPRGSSGIARSIGLHTALDTSGFPGRAGHRRDARRHRPGAAGRQVRAAGDLPRGDQPRAGADPGVRPPAGRAGQPASGCGTCWCPG